MRNRLVLYWLILVLLMSSLASCQPDLLRYGNRATCLGYFDARGDIQPAGFPVKAAYADMGLGWNETYEAIVLLDQDGVLHLVNPAGEVTSLPLNSVQKRATGGSLAVEGDLLAFSTGVDQSGSTYVYSLRDEATIKMLQIIPRFGSPAWHPHHRRLAGVYYPNGYDSASNVIGVFELRDRSPVLIEKYELSYSYLGGSVSWSSNGQVIAVTQYRENGLVPQYIFVNTGDIEPSQFSVVNENCVTDGTWAPDKQTFAFAGMNEMTEGWDIFLEGVAFSDGNEDPSLVNVTNSPREDEVDLSWSPSGEQIVYVKAYRDSSGNPRQDLFLLDISSYHSVLLTDTQDVFETSPIWLTDSEMIFLSWSPANDDWFLNKLMITKNGVEITRVFEVPQSWYRNLSSILSPAS